MLLKVLVTTQTGCFMVERPQSGTTTCLCSGHPSTSRRRRDDCGAGRPSLLALLGSAWLCEDLPGPVCRPLLCLPARSNPLSSPHLFVLASPKIHQDSHIIAYLASQPAPTLLSPSFACSKVSKISYPSRFTIPKIAYRSTNIPVLGPLKKNI